MNTTKAPFLLLASLLAGLLQAGHHDVAPDAALPIASAVAALAAPTTAPGTSIPAADQAGHASQADRADPAGNGAQEGGQRRDQPPRPVDRSKFAAAALADHTLGTTRVVSGKGVSPDRHF